MNSKLVHFLRINFFRILTFTTQTSIKNISLGISAIYETDAASKKFLVNKATAPEQLRVINRCEIMLKVVKRLLPVLSGIVNNSITMNTIYNKSVKRKTDTTHLSKFIFIYKNY